MSNGRDGTTRVPIDKQSPEVYRALIEAARAVRKTAQAAGLDRTLVELVNIRVSQINGAWRDTSLFSDKERAALTLAESLTTLPDPRTQDQDYAEASLHLSPEEVSAVAWVAISMNAFNRISIVSRHPVPVEAPGHGKGLR